MRKNTKRAICYFVGLWILGLGISLTILADLGTGAWDALHVGLANISSFTVGNWVIFVGVFLVLINSLLMRKKPDLLSMMTVIILGYIIDFWLLYIFADIEVTSLPIQYTVLFSGILLMGLGISIYLQADFAVVPIDGFMFALKHVLKLKLMLAKTTAEVIALFAAFLIGGPIGIGTLIVTFTVGPLIHVLYPIIEKFVFPKELA